MLYFKARVTPHWPEWGNAVRYLEIGDDLYATRHIDVYDCGKALRYDRKNWADDLGTIADAKYDAKRWKESWGPREEITATEFEAVWESTASAPNQPQAYSADPGPWPMLTAEQWRKARGLDT